MFQIFGDSLRHTTYNQVLPEIIHRPAVESLHRKTFVKSHPYIRHQHLVSHSPQEFLKVHRKHFNGVLFGGSMMSFTFYLIEINESVSM